jgi:tRNA/tmRNA/rRNA uracil-C5-methylase (TrmA/RlmC/RlmD family)
LKLQKQQHYVPKSFTSMQQEKKGFINLKKGQIIEGVIQRVDFPNKGIIQTEDGKTVIVKNGIEGQKVSASINKVRKGKAEGRLLEVLEKSPQEMDTPGCIHYGNCGGCAFQTLPYEEQLSMKARQVKKLMDDVIDPENRDYAFLGIKASPSPDAYRNKMEFSFGDEYKDGPLALGMHKRGSFYDIVNVPECQIVDEDFRTILAVTLEYFKGKEITYYHKLRHTGYLRHLLVRKGVKTKEILVDLVTTTQLCNTMQQCDTVQPEQKSDDASGAAAVNERAFDEAALLDGWKNALLAADYTGKLTGVLHTKNDSVADVVKNEGTDVLFGQDYFYEELLGLRFKITPFSFFQTNSLGAEILYQTARDFIGDALNAPDKIVFDLYSGTGTIAQMLSPVAKKVIGVEIVEEAVEAAKENAALNGLHNCEFVAGDVLKVIDEITEKPEYIVLDPPRDGIHPKALEKIIRYGVPQMVYISCKPTSLARDLETLQARGYRVQKVCCVDMFPHTANIETVCLLSKLTARPVM